MVNLRVILSMIVGLAVAGLTAFPSQASAHPFHISIAELQFNPESGKIEASLKVHVVDLERELARLAKTRVRVESDELSKYATRFLDSYFYLIPLADAKKAKVESLLLSRGSDATPVNASTVEFVGHELETSWAWLYFELTPPDGTEDLALVDAVFLNTIEQQINTVTVRHGAERHALKLTRKTPWAPFPRKWLAKPDAAATISSDLPTE